MKALNKKSTTPWQGGVRVEKYPGNLSRPGPPGACPRDMSRPELVPAGLLIFKISQESPAPAALIRLACKLYLFFETGGVSDSSECSMHGSSLHARLPGAYGYVSLRGTAPVRLPLNSIQKQTDGTIDSRRSVSRSDGNVSQLAIISWSKCF